ncbi:FxDxF family PEP-CTERM protein [Rhizorhapis sp. SPR117]|uniref:FxDxF family PEP-CTERM protein n=1 Tax=Rhizorhapis sp. SPR117 TaxID=2912611 RepID=UPI001F47A870|nr:FxDxF family PEP-CTERM protein [Rhizorhapis sp. SPR117]
MKKLLLSAALAMSTIIVSAPAQAAAVISFDGSTGTFGNTVLGAGAFSDTLHFTVPGMGSVGATISSIAVSLLNNVDFTSVTLNGQAFDIINMGMQEYRSITLPVTAGEQTLVISGTSGGRGSYSGTLAFAVPEPASWAMMITGFGLVGGAIRMRRRKGIAVPALA